MQSLIKGFWL